MNWITNHPKSVKGMWPRRAGVEYIEGAPRGTDEFTSEQLAAEGLVGVYVEMDLAEYRELPLIKAPKDLKK